MAQDSFLRGPFIRGLDTSARGEQEVVEEDEDERVGGGRAGRGLAGESDLFEELEVGRLEQLLQDGSDWDQLVTLHKHDPKSNFPARSVQGKGCELTLQRLDQYCSLVNIPYPHRRAHKLKRVLLRPYSASGFRQQSKNP